MDVSGSLSNSQSSGALRRSSRLYTNSNWVKENTTAPKASKITRTPAKRSRRTISFDKNSDQKEIGDLGKGGENMKGSYILPESNAHILNISPLTQ